jgi:hypothetical protein
MLFKSCSSSHTEHKKIGFAIFGIFYHFIWILQGAAETHKRGENHFVEDLWKVSNLHRSALGLHKTPWKFLGPCNVALGAWGGAAHRIPARPAAGMAGEG